MSGGALSVFGLGALFVIDRVKAMKPRANLVLPALFLLLSACGSGTETTAPEGDEDPAVAGALADPIMTDPDLSGQNQRSAALGGGGPASAGIPPENQSPEAIAAARAEALKLAGGALRTAPAASASGSGGPAAEDAVVIAAAALAGKPGAACTAKLAYSAVWAARLPAAFPVYPRGHVQEAAGSDAAGCSLRSVNYLTPVTVPDVVDFYFTRANAAGFRSSRRLVGVDDVLEGSKAAAQYYLRVRKAEDGLTEVDLVTSGN